MPGRAAAAPAAPGGCAAPDGPGGRMPGAMVPGCGCSAVVPTGGRMPGIPPGIPGGRCCCKPAGPVPWAPNGRCCCCMCCCGKLPGVPRPAACTPLATGRDTLPGAAPGVPTGRAPDGTAPCMGPAGGRSPGCANGAATAPPSFICCSCPASGCTPPGGMVPGGRTLPGPLAYCPAAGEWPAGSQRRQQGRMTGKLWTEQ